MITRNRLIIAKLACRGNLAKNKRNPIICLIPKLRLGTATGKLGGSELEFWRQNNFSIFLANLFRGMVSIVERSRVDIKYGLW